MDQNYELLQVETLILLRSLAETMSDLFVSHYATFMPGLKSILQTTPFVTSAQKDLRASCIASIGYIFESVKDQPEVCKADAHEVMASFVQFMALQSSQDGKSVPLDESDPQIISIQNALPQLAALLKSEFFDYLP